MVLTTSEARDWLRLDNGDNDAILAGLISSAAEYIELTTGLDETAQEKSQLAKTATKFLLSLWYDPTQVDTDKLQRSIDNLLKALS